MTPFRFGHFIFVSFCRSPQTPVLLSSLPPAPKPAEALCKMQRPPVRFASKSTAALHTSGCDSGKTLSPGSLPVLPAVLLFAACRSHNSIGIEYSKGFAINGQLAEEASLLSDGDVITLRMITESERNAVKESAYVPPSVSAHDFSAAIGEAANTGFPVKTDAVSSEAFEPRRASSAFAAVQEPQLRSVSASTLESVRPNAAITEAEAEKTAETAPDYKPAAVRSENAFSTYPESERDFDADEGNGEDEEEAIDIVPAITLTLNGKPLTLPEKNDGTPHTFVELMNKVDLDTKNPKGRDIELTLNGMEISFGAELHEGDRAIVRWKE